MGEALLEREGELARITSQLEGARADEGSALLIEAPAGIGKTALLVAARQAASASGFLVLTATGGELEAAVPFGIARQLLTRVLLAMPEDERQSVLAGAAGPAATALGLEGTSETLPGAADDGLTWTVIALSEARPIMVVVDDVHWADPDSARWLLHLSRRASELPVAVLLAARPAPATAEAPAIAALRADPSVALMEPAPLGTASVAALVRSFYAPEAEHDFIAACVEHAGGNPFYTHALLEAASRQEIPPDHDGAVRLGGVGAGRAARGIARRIGRLGEEVTKLARALAILGTATRVDHAAALSGLSGDAVERAADALVAEHVLEPQRPLLSFVHPLVLAAIRDDIPPGERSRMHADAAALLREDPREQAAAAAHLLEVRPAADPQTVDMLRAVARQAMHDGAPTVAARLLGRALDEPPDPADRPETMAEFARAQAAAGHPDAGAQLLAAAAAAPDPIEAARLTYDAAWYANVDAQVGRAVDAVERVLDGLRPDQAELRNRGEATLAELLLLSAAGHPTPPRVLSALERAPGLAGETLGERQLLAQAAFVLSVNGAVDAATVAALCERAGSDSLDHPTLQSLVGLALFAAGRPHQSLAASEAALALARQRGEEAGVAWALTWGALTKWRTGQLREAEFDTRQAVTIATRAAPGTGLWMFTLAYHLGALAARGALANAEAVIRSCPDVPGKESTHHDLLLNSSIGVIALEEGRHAEAVSRLTYSLEHLNEIWVNPAMNWHRPLIALGLTALGRRDEAVAIVEPDVSRAHEFGAPGPEGFALLSLGVALGGAEGRTTVERGCELLEQAEDPDRLARALVALGRMLRHDRRPREAREPLYRALELAERVGSDLCAQQAREELLAAGARPRDRPRSGAHALTAAEQRVARLAAAGRTNREIAHALFVAPKTVERHLAHCYEKLGIRSRHDLDAALAQEAEAGLAPTP